MKKWRKTAIIYGLIFFPLLLSAQEWKISNRIGIEGGGATFYGRTVVPDRIRTGESIWGGNFFTGGQVLDVSYGGIKYERYFLEKRMEFAAGLRFTQFSSDIYGGSGFLWKFNEGSIYTDYVRISSITQIDNYIGIPLECSYLLKESDSFFRPYVKMGIVVNRLIYTSNSIEFANEQMNQYAGAVGKQTPKPNLFNSYIYPAVGFKLGKNHHVWFDVEIQYLPFLMAKKAHPFISNASGMGSQFSIQIPLNKQSK